MDFLRPEDDDLNGETGSLISFLRFAAHLDPALPAGSGTWRGSSDGRKGECPDAHFAIDPVCLPLADRSHDKPAAAGTGERFHSLPQCDREAFLQAGRTDACHACVKSSR